MVLLDVAGILNSAVHAKDIEYKSAQWALYM
jgi:hypothetical protein